MKRLALVYLLLLSPLHSSSAPPRHTECGLVTGAPHKADQSRRVQTLVVAGFVGSGRRELQRLLDATGLCSSPPLASAARDEESRAFDEAGLSRLAHKVAAITRSTRYDVTVLPTSLRGEVQAALVAVVLLYSAILQT